MINTKDKKLRNLHICIIMFTVVILSSGYFTLYFLKILENESKEITIESRTEEYKLKVDGRIDSDMEMLSSLAAFFSDENNLKNTEFLQQFCNSNDVNSFIRMEYISTDGYVIRAYKGESYEITDISTIEAEIKKIVEQAFIGEQSVSELFTEKKNNEKSIGLAVPVYKNEKIIGALTGSYPTYIFDELLNNSKLQNGIKENVDLIEKDGTFIVLSKQSLVDGEKENIFQYDTYSEEEKESILKKINKEESFNVYYTVSGKKYLSRYIPVDNSDWYIIYSDTTNEIFEEISLFTNYLQIVLCILILFIIITIFILYKSILSRQKQLERIAYYDPMTGAFNLFKFQEEVKKSSNYIKGVANINVSRFRYINAEFGIENADKLLIRIAQIIKKDIKKNEFYGKECADSFWIAFADGDKERLKTRLENIARIVEEEFQSMFNGYKVSFFVGAACIYKHRIDVMERARFSLREAKKNKNAQITFWSEIEEEVSDVRLYVESYKEMALRNGEFKMYLQPKKNYKTGEFDSAEVLVRWIKPDGKMIFPDQFIPQFEENGFCLQLDLYMFEQACRTIRKWIDENKKVMRLSVNQSKLLFYKEDYVNLLCKITDKYQIKPEMLILEILENIAVDNMDRMNHVIENLQEKGFYISMDDFGSGYSSLSCFGSLKVNEIKFDRLFLKELDDEKNNKIIINNLVKAFKTMNISVVVEGIETEENEKFIQSIKVDYGQGYYYSKPISLEDFEKKYN